MDNGVSPLFSACQRENESIVQPLLLNGANLNLCRNDGTSCLHEACKNGYYGIVKLLLKSWATVNLCDKNEASPLALACKEGHESVVQFLLDNGANFNLCLAGGLVRSFWLVKTAMITSYSCYGWSGCQFVFVRQYNDHCFWLHVDEMNMWFIMCTIHQWLCF